MNLLEYYTRKRDEMFNAYQAVLDDTTMTPEERTERSTHYMVEYENYSKLCGGAR